MLDPECLSAKARTPSFLHREAELMQRGPAQQRCRFTALTSASQNEVVKLSSGRYLSLGGDSFASGRWKWWDSRFARGNYWLGSPPPA